MAVDFGVRGKIIRATIRAVAREINRQLLIDVVDKVRMVHVESCIQDADTDASTCHSSAPGFDSTHSRVAIPVVKASQVAFYWYAVSLSV
jgi:hypothetical protein